MIQSRLRVLIAEKESCEGHKLRYDDIAAETGLSKNTIYKLVNNMTGRIDFDTLDALCRYFECQPGEVIVYRP